jgi:phosphate:Na+ symporter
VLKFIHKRTNLTTRNLHIITIVLLLLFPLTLRGKNADLLGPNTITISGNNQYGHVSERLPAPFSLKMTTRLGEPIPGIIVSFKIISIPEGSEGCFLKDTTIRSNDKGLVYTTFTLGTKEGEYIVSAHFKHSSEPYLYFKAYARRQGWLFFMIIGIAGGLMLFLFGMKLMSEGLEGSAGSKMRSILGDLTHNRLMAFGSGTFISIVTQSSSATAVMAISFVNSKLMNFRQSLGIILGAAFGTCLTLQLIAFKVSDFSLLMIGIGFPLQYFTKNKKIKNIGEIVLGFGLLFFGMQTMSSSLFPVKSYTPFINLMQTMENPLFGIVIGAVFTAVLQSSAAFLGILMILASGGIITLPAAISLMLGANLGTSVTALLAASHSNYEAKKVAIAHTFFKIAGVILFIWWIPEFSILTRKLSLYISNNQQSPRLIANAYTFFNIVMALVLLPFIDRVASLVDKWMPKPPEKEEITYKTEFLDYNMLQTPVLAVHLAKQETLSLGNHVLDMVNKILSAFIDKSSMSLKYIEEQEKWVNFLHQSINQYLIEITQKNIREERSNEVFQIMYTIKELEHIGDLVSINLSEKARKWIESDKTFSEQGQKELKEYHHITMNQLQYTLDVFNEVNLIKAKELKTAYKKYRELSFEMEKHHFERLTMQLNLSIQSSETHLEIMDMLRTISSHATNIDRILMEWSEKFNVIDENAKN